jgi:superfamily II DNA or RNA helicase
MVAMRFAAGSVVLADHPDVRGAMARIPSLVVDDRERCLRAPAMAYAAVVAWCVEHEVAVEDEARRYQTLMEAPPSTRVLRPDQEAALHAWRQASRRGVVVMPTGAGKTEVAMAAIALCRRSTLVVAPTIELVRQWQQRMQERIQCDIGVLGDGEHTLLPLTVSTYESASRFMMHYGGRIGLLVCDECHHLPTPQHERIAAECIAPYRLGLSATPERADGTTALTELLGPIVYRSEVRELEGVLAPYDVCRMDVPLTAANAQAYAAARVVFRAFVDEHRISFGGPMGFKRFLQATQRQPGGHEALAAYRQQRKLAVAAVEKRSIVAKLIDDHRGARTLVFTDDNETAYALGRELLVPVLTHETKTAERAMMIAHLRSGRWPVLASSKVLNEGIDVPEAEVAIIVSGSGSVREHVQRLGRILRASPGKRAKLYELVTETNERYTSDRRREHDAYR